MHRRTAVLQDLGLDVNIATVAEGEHAGKTLGQLLDSDSDTIKADAAKARRNLLTYMGERLISNNMV